jgi:hypothetical protein
VLVGILGVSLFLRILLVLAGGQNYWPDEERYDRSRVGVDAIAAGDWDLARRALSQPDHILFGVLGLLPAGLERLTGRDLRIPALFFALFSVASILLVYGIMLRLGESPRASCLGAALFALSTTQLYYARHLLPYDAAMAFGLLALYVGLRETRSLHAAVLCGLLSCAAFLTYNGYWLLSGVALLTPLLHGERNWSSLSKRLAAATGAFLLPLVAIGALGGHLLRAWLSFSGTVSQGRYSEGWRLPLAYLWRAEHGIAILWALALTYAAWKVVRGERSGALVFGVVGFASIYAGLVLMSVGLERAVVYGRQARQLVPFACVVTAAVLARIWTSSQTSRRGREAVAAVLAAVVVQAAANFHRPLTQVFPPEFRRLAEPVAAGANAPTLLLFAEHIYPTPAPVPATGPVLLARPHPLQFLPYQYEGYTPEERAALRNTDIRMRLVLLAPGQTSMNRPNPTRTAPRTRSAL